MQQWCLAAALAAALSCALAPARWPSSEPRTGSTYTRSSPRRSSSLRSRRRASTLRAAGRPATRAQMILTADQAQHVRAAGRRAKLTRVKGGKTVKQFAAAQAASGFTVWRSYDEPGGYPRPDARSSRAHTRGSPSSSRSARRCQGREILALKVTQGARGQRDGSRPAVLFSATQHAREWIATETDRRLMYHYIDGLASQRQADQEAAQGDGAVVRPGHEPGRLPVHVRHRAAVAQEPARQRRRRPDDDRRRRRPEPQLPGALQVRRGGLLERSSRARPTAAPARRQSPRRRRSWACSERVGFEFNVNYHSNGQWLLYPEGWQVGSPTADDPIYYALSGNLDRPAIAGFHPGLSSDVLYVTNGEANDYAAQAGRRAGLDARS